MNIIQPQAIQRAHGAALIAVRLRDGKTVLDDLYQKANAKLRVPKTYGEALEAVLINTAGGVAGGDTLRLDMRIGAGSALSMSTQTCERLYKTTDGSTAEITNSIDVQPGGFCAWLPQETIAFNGASLRRTLTVELAAGAGFIGHESVVLGRALMGETIDELWLDDRWMIKRAGRPLHIERLRLDGPLAPYTKSAALLSGQTVMTTIVLVPDDDGAQLPLAAKRVRAVKMPKGITIGVSVFDQKLVCRLLSFDSYLLRQQLPAIFDALRPGLKMPKVWRI